MKNQNDRIIFHAISYRAIKITIACAVLFFACLILSKVSPWFSGIAMLCIIGVLINIFISIFSILISGKIVTLDATGLQVKYFLPFRKSWKEEYVNVVSYTTWQGYLIYGGMRPILGKAHGVIVALKNGRLLNVHEFDKSKYTTGKIEMFLQHLDNHGIKNLGSHTGMPSISNNPYL